MRLPIVPDTSLGVFGMLSERCHPAPRFSYCTVFATLESMKRAILSLFLFFAGTAFSLLGPVFSFALPHGTVLAQDTVGTSACKFVPDDGKRALCKSCFDGGGAWTALGCFGKSQTAGDPSTINDFLKSFIGLGTGIGGGIAFLLILFSGFQRITSTGNPEKLHEAKELMTAAISGLLLIIFSVFLLRLIGVDILQIPGFG